MPVENTVLTSAKPQHVVIYHDGWRAADALRAALERDGCVVKSAATFQVVQGWLMLFGSSTVVVLVPPTVDTFRRAVLDAVRRAHSDIPIIVLVPAVSDAITRETEDARVTHLLTTDVPPALVAERVRSLRQS